jgi:Raf kinase inhibitor-like YbhB/YbcL family protein
MVRGGLIVVKTRITYVLSFVLVLFTISSSMGGEKMELSSSAFNDGGKIPIKYAMRGAGGENISLPLAWKNAPEGTKSFALSMIDHHPVANNWVHWLVIDIPPDASSLQEGASGKEMPQGSMELRNSFGAIGYGGPQPPPGTGDHPYVVTLYALNVDKLDLDRSTDLSRFRNSLKGKVLGEAVLTGYYGR